MATHFSDDDREQIRVAILAGDKITAIKRCRECAGLGLKDAKDLVEAFEAELRGIDPPGFSAQPARKGCAGAAVLVAGFAFATLQLCRHL